MDLEETDLVLTQEALETNWDVAPLGKAPEDLNRQMLLEALEERITYLLKHNPEKLLTALYLLDVSEKRHREAMAEPTTQTKARALAELILLRESEKIETRKKYAAQMREAIEDKANTEPGTPPAAR
jgi:hypothetical protein